MHLNNVIQNFTEFKKIKINEFYRILNVQLAVNSQSAEGCKHTDKIAG